MKIAQTRKIRRHISCLLTVTGDVNRQKVQAGKTNLIKLLFQKAATQPWTGHLARPPRQQCPRDLY